MKQIFGLLVFLVSTGTATATPREAVDYVRDAVERVNDEGGKCKRDMAEDLREAQDLLRDRDYKGARKLITTLANDAGKCPARVAKLLRRAVDALDDDDDRDDRRHRDRDDRPAAKPPERAKNVPWADWSADCRSMWMIVEIARYNTDDATLNKLAGLSGTACQGPGLPASSWPNGQTAKTAQGTFYYPNGQTAKTGEGNYYYPNGQTAKTSSGTWYYPNGQTARSGATWYYANGQQAGGFQMLVSDACTRGGEAMCNRYKGMLASDVEDWRAFAVVQLVAQSSKNR